MASKLRNALDTFFITTKKGYDSYYWIFVIIAGAGIITKLFGIAGAGASIVGFLTFYILGRISIKRDKRLAKEKLLAKK
ncbi:MAG: hypothetical protein ABR981_04855 [Candidatus Micrarchaeaceae archaeon]|jgi:hypothetical protein